jgi:multiple sugar transport system permease protein
MRLTKITEGEVAEMKLEKGISRVMIYSACIILGVIFFYPLFYVITNSLRNLYSTPSLFPKEFSFVNYYLAVTLIPFFLYFRNSVILVVLSLGFSVIMNLLFGYAFARINAPGRNFLFAIVLAQLMIPGIAISIPQYVLFSNIGLKNTYWIWVLGGIGGEAFFIFLFRQFYATIPKDFEDAARIDGCNVLGTIWRVFVPMSKPVIAVVAFFNFQNVWGDYMTPFMYLNEEQYPLAMALFSANYDLPVNIGGRSIPIDPLINAASIIMILPVILVFFIAQKYLVQGIITTGIKG